MIGSMVAARLTKRRLLPTGPSDLQSVIPPNAVIRMDKDWTKNAIPKDVLDGIIEMSERRRKLTVYDWDLIKVQRLAD